MAERRTPNPQDALKYITQRIMEETARNQESWANLAELGEQLRRLSTDAGQRLLTRD